MWLRKKLRIVHFVESNACWERQFLLTKRKLCVDAKFVAARVDAMPAAVQENRIQCVDSVSAPCIIVIERQALVADRRRYTDAAQQGRDEVALRIANAFAMAQSVIRAARDASTLDVPRVRDVVADEVEDAPRGFHRITVAQTFFGKGSDLGSVAVDKRPRLQVGFERLDGDEFHKTPFRREARRVIRF